MKAFTHLALLALLFQATSQNIATLNVSSATDATAVTSTNTSAISPTTPTMSPTTTNTTAPTDTNTSTSTDTTAPTDTNTSNTTDTTAPTVTGTSNTTDTTAPTVTGTSNTTDTTAPTDTNTSNTTDTTAPTDTNTSNTTDTTAPTDTNTSNTTDTTAPTVTNTSTATTENTTSNTATSTPTPTDSSTPCKEDSCKDGSSCVNLHNDYFCLCSEGYYYNSSTCNKGKIFPGTIKVIWSYTSELENEASEEYQNLYIKVTTFFKDAFNNSDYGQTVIVKVSISSSARSEMRAGNLDVDVAVVNIFTETTKENETTISNAITNAIRAQSSSFLGYDQQDRCDYYGCKKPNNQTDCDSGLLCECKEGLARPNSQIPMCVASCPDTCNAQNKRQCLVTSNRSAACVCLSGYKEDSQGTCQKCAFGYSGVDCKDSFQLILTIVGTIAGILVLGMLIALIVSMRLKNKGRDVEEETLIEKDSQNLRLKETGFSNLGAEGSIFPKIRVNLPRDNEPQNPYARHGGLPRPDY